MVLIWNDTESFRRHLEAMEVFRRSHSELISNRRCSKDMPTKYIIDLAHGERLIIYLDTSNGRMIFIPIWKMEMPINSEN
jgi:hypothetical protein